MRFSLWPGPHQSFAALRELALHAEATGWDGLWLADHFLPARGDLSRPTLECWSALAGLAACVPRVTLGTLVCGVTYRQPALLAKMAATVDHVSGGRLVLGLGAAWQENEHRAYGVAFPRIAQRLERLDEACAVLRSLFEEERTTFAGRHFVMRDAVLEPKPLQQPLPLLVGGGGERVTLRIAARRANAWNAWGTPAQMHHKNAALDRHCAAIGRDPATLRRSAVALFHLTDDAAEAERVRAGARQPCVAGDAAALRAAVDEYRAAGVDELVVPDFEQGRSAALDRFAREVIAPVRRALQTA